MPGQDLNDLQREFHLNWTGPRIAVVRSVKDALEATGIAL